MRRCSIAVLHLQCSPKPVSADGLATLLDRGNVCIALSNSIEELLPLLSATLCLRLCERTKEKTHLKLIISIRQVNRGINKVKPILMIITMQADNLYEFSISYEV